MAVPHSHSSTLFVTRDGAPMRFYVRPGPMKRQLAPLIAHGGGVVCRIQEPGAFLLADPAEGQLGPGYISTAYVSDCVGRNRCLSPRTYRLLPPLSQKTRADQSQKFYSTLTASQGAPGWTRDHKSSAVDLTNKEDATIQGNMDTCTSMVTAADAVDLTNKEDATIQGNMDTCTSMVTAADAVDLTNKEDATIQGNMDTCTSMVTAADAVDLTNKEDATIQGTRDTCTSMVTAADAVDLTNKEDATIQGNIDTCTSLVTTTDAVDLTNKDDATIQSNMDTCTSMVTAADAVDLTNKDDATIQGTRDTCTSMVTAADAVDLTNKEDATIQGNMDTCTSLVTTTEEAAGGREDNMEQIGNPSPERTHGDMVGLKEHSAVDLTNKEDAAIQDNRKTFTSMVTTAKEATGELGDNLGQMRNLNPEMTNRDKKDLEERSAIDLRNKQEAAIQGNRKTCTSLVLAANEATGKENVEQVVNPSSERTPGDKEDLKECSAVDLTNKEVTIQGNRDTCTSPVATTKETTGERGDKMKQMGNPSSERTNGDEEGLEGSPVDLTKKEERAIWDRTCTSIVTTTKKATGEDSVKKEEITTSGPTTKSLASRSRIPTEAASGHGEDLKTVACTALSRDGTCTEAATGDGRDKNIGETLITSSGAQKKHSSLRKMDVEQTLNEDENYSMLVIPDPRTSTPALGNPNTVKDLETHTAHDRALGKDGESPLEIEFRRPVRKVASKIRFSDRVNQHSPDMEQNRAEKRIDMHTKPKHDTPMSVQESHCGEAEPGAQKYTARKPDIQSADSQQGQSFVSVQSPKSAPALRKGRMAFTKEEDMAILLYIRDNVSSRCTVTGNVLWKEMEKKKVLGRTWQATKARYVKYLVNHKYKYKLPPKCPSLQTKDSSSRRMQGLAKTDSLCSNCPTSTGTPQKHNATLTSASGGVPQNCDTTLPSPSNDPQNRVATLPGTSDDVPQNRVATLPGTSDDVPQNCVATLPGTSDDVPQNRVATLPGTSDDVPQNRVATLPGTSDDVPQNRVATLPGTSDDVPQNRVATLPGTSDDVPQNRVATLPGTSDDVPQNRVATLPGTSDVPQNRVATLPGTSDDVPQNLDAVLPIACTVTPQKCDVMLPSSSTDTPPNNDQMLPATSAILQKGDSVLPSTSADTYPSCSITQRGAATFTNTLANNVAFKERSILTPRKTSRDPTNDESSPPEKGSRMSNWPHSSRIVVSYEDGSSDLSEYFHIFERANMEFEETDDTVIQEQAVPAATQTEGKSNTAKHVDETPSTSQPSDSEHLIQAVNAMMNELKLDVSCVAQALFFNSGELGSTRHFLHTGTRPDGYPIWEPKDDLDLKTGNPKTQSHLINKYGADNVARRAAFLAS